MEVILIQFDSVKCEFINIIMHFDIFSKITYIIMHVIKIKINYYN